MSRIVHMEDEPMTNYTCPRCQGPAVLVEQTKDLSCVGQCDETLADELLRKELEGLVGALARLVGGHTPEGYVFTLLLTKTGRKGCSAYASSAQRQDMISLLREWADKLAVTAGRPS